MALIDCVTLGIDDLRPKEWLGAKTKMVSFCPRSLQEVTIL